MGYLMQSNILVFFLRHIFLFKNALKTRPKLYYIVNILKYASFAYALYLGKAYSGVIYYMVCCGLIVIQHHHMQKSWFTKVTLTLFILWCNLMTLNFNVFHLLPYIILISYILIRPYTRGFIRQRVFDVEDLMLIIYAYHYKIYVLFFYELVDFVFRKLSSIFKKLIKFTEERTCIE